MKVTRYSPKDLSSMTLKSLAEVGAKLKPPLKFTKHHSRASRARSILAAYSEAETRSLDRSQIPRNDSAATAAPTTLHEQKPAFEKLCETACPDPASPKSTNTVDGQAQKTPGGVRAGAGRPEGMSSEIAAYNSLPQQPHPAIREMIELLFKTWSARVKCDEVALTKDQAFDLALPWTQAAHLLGVTDRIPAGLMVAVACIWSSVNMVTAKASIARAAVKPEPEKKAA